MANGGGSGGGPGRAVLACLGAVLLLVGWVGWWAYHLVRPSPPDVAAVARASGTRALGQSAASLTDRQIGSLKNGLGWAEAGGTAVVDECGADLGRGLGPFSYWGPVTCGRSVTLYLGFDGELRDRLADIDRVVAALGWGGGTPALGGSAPVPVARTYSRLGPALPQTRLTLRVTRAAAGAADVEPMPCRTDAAAGGVVECTAPDRAVYVAKQAVAAAGLARADSHAYLATFTIDAPYYPMPGRER
ncbi:hypothetical protein [Kitasatospora viridis]|uniref:Uncharacterized protein n=1 Tax=Kitasatospora viridis TaxID=281105 RepID=A0A561UMG3_9ACTN|nr:hypothetical protein [Kitasatospora viridis]TWG00563.1 hypothetical protein FHX73_114443 [Kitasatospora viridis]